MRAASRFDLREANEKLVLAAMESERQKDQAEAAQTAAELTTQALRQIERDLLNNAELREQLLGAVGHDLRNPLNAISMCAQLMVTHGALGEEDDRLAEMIQRCAGRMERMIAHVLDFTRVRLGGGLVLAARPADLREVCEQAIAELAVHPGVRIRSDFAGDLTGVWDEDRLVEVVSNLLGNAVDHAAPETTVLVRGRVADASVVVEIINQGEPIPAELLPVIFAPFRLGRQDTGSKLGHLGLGLYISREIISSHGGTIIAGSTGGTTTFSVHLPRTLQSP